MEDKRRFTRVPFKMKTKMTVGDTVFDADEICNLSIGGCLLPFDAPYADGTPCQVEILLNEEAPDMIVCVDGEIIRRDHGMIAVRFIRIDPDSLFHLRNIIRYNSSDPDMIEEEIEKHPGLL